MSIEEIKQIELESTDLPIPIVNKLKRVGITKMSHLLELDEEKLITVSSKLMKSHHIFLGRKEIYKLKEFIYQYVPERFSVEEGFRYLSEKTAIGEKLFPINIKKVTIYEIYTASEASELWGLERSAVRKAIDRNKFEKELGEIRKSGGTWLVTKEAMERVFGTPNRDGKKMNDNMALAKSNLY